jgi:hypothetical protein
VHPPPSPGWADFIIMMECMPESGHCHSVCTLWCTFSHTYTVTFPTAPKLPPSTHSHKGTVFHPKTRFMYKLYRHKLYREQIVSAQIVSAQFCIGTICIGHKLYRHNLYRHNLYRHNLYRTQIVSGTNCIGHKLYLVTN